MIPKLTRPSQFDVVFREGVRRSDANLRVAVRPNDQSTCRLGMAIGRISGGAIRRNLVRRRIREVFRRRLVDTTPSCDIVVSLSRGGSTEYRDIETSLLNLVASARRKLATRGAEG